MALISKDSIQALNDRWGSLFNPEKVEVGVVDTTKHKLKPIRAPSSIDKSYSFEVSSLGDRFLDLKSFQLYVKGVIIDENDSLVNLIKTSSEEAENVFPVNNFLHSLFETVKCEIGQNQKNLTVTDYNYKAYLKQLIKAEQNQVDLELQGFILDEGKDPQISGVAKNTGAQKRRAMFANGVEMQGQLMVDMFQSEGYLIPNTPLRITLIRSEPAFYLLHEGKQCKFLIEDISLEVTSVKAEPALVNEIEQELENRPCVYRWDDLVMKSYTLSQNALTASFQKIFESVLPRKLIFAIVSQNAYKGHESLSPYYFNHNFIDKLGLSINGLEVRCHRPNFEAGQFTKSYSEFLNLVKNKLTLVNKDHFSETTSLFCYDLLEGCTSSIKCSEEILQTGVMDLMMSFSKKLPAPMMLLVFAYLPGELHIDKNRQVIV